MAPLQNSSCHRNLLLLYLLLVFITSALISSALSQNQQKISGLSTKTRMPMDHIIDDNNDDETSLKNHIKLSSSKNQTKPNLSKKNDSSSISTKSQLIKKPNSISNSQTKPHIEKIQTKKPQKQLRSFINEDLVSELKTLPSKIQETFVPDMQKISKTSKKYLKNYNKQITKGFKPYVGNKYATTIAPIISLTFIIIPLIFFTIFLNKILPYFSAQEHLIFIHIYLAIYFFVLALTSWVTGLEPLKIFYSASQTTYMCVLVLQILAYVLYLLLLLVYLILVFSSDTGLAAKLLGLGQTFVGFSVGLHYYITVIHRAVLHQPPKSSWKAYGLYATCFVVICLLATVNGRKKKAYLEEGGEEGKKS